jgi:XTP/dITP diphosphohydrolase
MSRVLIATENRGKVTELHALLGERVDVASLDDVGLAGAEETGETFEENAILKATSAARSTGLIAIADDSGIEVDALGGAPGVRSARYDGEGATDERNRVKLLRELAALGAVDRAARFVCAIAVASPDGEVRTFHGALDGTVATEPRGSGGFGYDAILMLQDGRTVAELTPDEKNRISHRGTALKNALPYINELIGSEAATVEG